MFHILIADRALFFAYRDGVAVRRGGRKWNAGLGTARFANQLTQQKLCAFRPFAFQHRLERIQPLLRFLWVNVLRVNIGGVVFHLAMNLS